MPLMFMAPLPAAPPVIPPDTVGAGQLYVVNAGITPFTPSAGNDVNVPPLHIVVVMFVIAGFGLTVTVTEKSAPEQLPEVGVTVYVAV